MRSPYMEFSKLRSSAKYTLSTSGVEGFPLSKFPVSVDELEINGPTVYGYAPLQERMARMNGVSPQCVVAAAGTSMANHLAMAVAFEPGDEVLIEYPTYELLESTARYLGAEVRHFERRREEEFRVNPSEVARQITPRTKLIVLTNLHNPTGVLIDENTMRDVGEIARDHGSRVLVDEVYLEMLYEQRPRSAFHLGEHFLVTSSLTKAYGLSGLRCGWILASPDLAERMWHINDLYGSIAAHAAELLSVIAIDHLDRPARRAREILAANVPILRELLGKRRDLEIVWPPQCTIVFPRLLSGKIDDFCRLLREKYETSVVPGNFFGVSDSFRVGVGGDPEMTREGLKRLTAALDEFGRG